MPDIRFTLIDDFILLINELRILTKDCDCDFNLDQMLPENVTKGYPFIKTFNLDPISDTSNPNAFSSFLSLYRIITFFLFSKANKFTCKQFSFQSSLHDSKILVLASCLLYI